MEANNFIEEIINKDLEDGKFDTTVTRFPPEPNGYLHIGHAKSLCINFGIKEKYKGKCNLRFDDTNPTKEDVEYVDSIKEDIKWLGFSWDKELYASDYFEKLYDYAVLLIKKGLAYVCDLSSEEIKEYRGTLTEKGKNSPYRDRSIEENLKLFEEMREGKYQDGEKVLRAKIDMASSNMNMRDPVIYRILRANHHRTGDKWCIYPMYDFTHPLSDSIEGITHSICTLEFEDHRPLYDWANENCEISNPPHQYEFARLNLTHTIMSKRYLKKLVDEGAVDGWDDPRMPTLCGLRRRGYSPLAIKEFCNRIGVAKANSEVDISYLEELVREELNENAMRVMAVLNPLKVTITNYEDDSEELLIENYYNKDEKRKVSFSKTLFIDESDFSLDPPKKYKRLTLGGTVRLKGAYIIQCDDIKQDKNGKVTELVCSYFKNSKSGEDNGEVKAKGVIHWVDANNAIDIKCNKFEYLLNDAEFPGQDFSERINKNSIIKLNAKGEKILGKLPYGTRVQFLRTGYYIKDKKMDAFNEIVALKDSFNKKADVKS